MNKTRTSNWRKIDSREVEEIPGRRKTGSQLKYRDHTFQNRGKKFSKTYLADVGSFYCCYNRKTGCKSSLRVVDKNPVEYYISDHDHIHYIPPPNIPNRLQVPFMPNQSQNQPPPQKSPQARNASPPRGPPSVPQHNHRHPQMGQQQRQGGYHQHQQRTQQVHVRREFVRPKIAIVKIDPTFVDTRNYTSGVTVTISFQIDASIFTQIVTHHAEWQVQVCLVDQHGKGYWPEVVSSSLNQQNMARANGQGHGVRRPVINTVVKMKDYRSLSQGFINVSVMLRLRLQNGDQSLHHSELRNAFRYHPSERMKSPRFNISRLNFCQESGILLVNPRQGSMAGNDDVHIVFTIAMQQNFDRYLRGDCGINSVKFGDTNAKYDDKVSKVTEDFYKLEQWAKSDPNGFQKVQSMGGNKFVINVLTPPSFRSGFVRVTISVFGLVIFADNAFEYLPNPLPPRPPRMTSQNYYDEDAVDDDDMDDQHRQNGGERDEDDEDDVDDGFSGIHFDDDDIDIDNSSGGGVFLEDFPAYHDNNEDFNTNSGRSTSHSMDDTDSGMERLSHDSDVMKGLADIQDGNDSFYYGRDGMNMTMMDPQQQMQSQQQQQQFYMNINCGLMMVRGNNFMDQNNTDFVGSSSVNYMIAQNRFDWVKFLVEKKNFDVEKKNLVGVSPLDVAHYFGRDKILTFLELQIIKKRNDNFLGEAAIRDINRMVNAEDTDLPAFGNWDQDANGNSRLFYAVAKANIEEIKMIMNPTSKLRELMKVGKDYVVPDITRKNSLGVNVLDIVKYLDFVRNLDDDDDKKYKRIPQYLYRLVCENHCQQDIMIDLNRQTITHVCTSKSKRRKWRNRRFYDIRTRHHPKKAKDSSARNDLGSGEVMKSHELGVKILFGETDCCFQERCKGDTILGGVAHLGRKGILFFPRDDDNMKEQCDEENRAHQRSSSERRNGSPRGRERSIEKKEKKSKRGN